MPAVIASNPCESWPRVASNPESDKLETPSGSTLIDADNMSGDASSEDESSQEDSTPIDVQYDVDDLEIIKTIGMSFDYT